MSTTTPRRRRSPEEWQDLAREVLPHLQAGASLTELNERFEIGTHADAVKSELARLGYDPHGEPMELKPMTVRRPGAVANYVAKRRRDGAPWWLLIAETSMSYGELNRHLREHGFDARGNKVDSTNGASA